MWDGFATVVSKFKKFKSVVAVLEMLIEICDIFLLYGVGLHCIVLYCIVRHFFSTDRNMDQRSKL